jgi:UDP-glucose 4-epimerase
MKALVTGGTGFIGSSVVDYLLTEGHRVRLFSRRPGIPESLQEKSVEAFQGDLENTDSVIEAMNGIDVFYHIGEIKNTTRAQSEKNVDLLRKIVGYSDAKGVRRLVFVSSITVAGIPSEFPADEDTKPRAMLRDHYTEYKRRCEDIIGTRTGAFEYAVVRPAPVYGPGSRYLGRLVRGIELLGPVGLPFIGTARNNTPLIHVKDLARAICLAGVQPAAAGQVFNLTDGLHHTWFDFFSAIARELGKSMRIIPIPALLLKIPALPVDLLSAFFSMELDPVRYLDYFSRDLIFDNAKARSLLNWTPEYSLHEGVREMVAHYKNWRQR